MKTIILFTLVLLSGYAASAQYNNVNLYLNDNTPYALFTYRNMRVYPVYARQSFVNTHKNIGKYTSLDEALKQKKIKITEAAEGEVNKLFIENLSRDTIIILGGEIVKGGMQDRMIATDMLVPPTKGKVDLNVFCVEHGRWSYGDGETRGTGKGSGSGFTVTTGAACTAVRKEGAVSKNQGFVWNKVADVTTKNNSSSGTGTYNALVTNPTYTNDIAGYKKFFNKLLSSDSTIIGMVVVSGDSIIGCDLFASHHLLMQSADNIIGSYATDVITYGSKVTISYARVKEYMDSLLADEVKQEKMITKNGTMLKYKNKKLHIASY